MYVGAIELLDGIVERLQNGQTLKRAGEDKLIIVAV